MSKPIDADRERGSLPGTERTITDAGGDPRRIQRAGASRIDTLPGELARLVGLTPIEPGQIIGERYQLIERLGVGAMGEVFLAENLAIGIKVAVKLLKPELLADASFRQRFQREAQAIAAIEHPNVARFLDLVVGEPTFLVMEYVRGSSLSVRLRDGKLPVDQAIGIALRLCWALRASHAVGVIHRDLKPGNVVLSSDVEHRVVPKLIDFGLAKLAARAQDESLTRAGQLVGTPHYMSPEQISGKKVDARTDIYALGCLLYEMVSGSVPFAEVEDDIQVLYKQVHEVAPPLRTRAPDAPAALEAVIARALAKRSDDRYESTEEMAAALEALREPKAGASSTQAVPPAARRSQVGRNFAIAAAVLVVLGFGGGFLASRLGHRHGVEGAAALFVLSDPAGAKVSIDGRPLSDTTPALVSGLVAGPHTVRIERAGASPVIQSMTLGAGERSAVQVTLPPVSRRVEVRSVPDGAQVYLDRRLALGVTPTWVVVTQDDFHELQIEKQGYQTIKRALTPDDKETTLSFSLEPETQPRGTVMVDANSAAEVWIDGVPTGYTTPTLGIEEPIGRHTVEVRDAAGTIGQVAHIDVKQGQTLRLLLGTAAAAAAKGKP